MSVPALAIASKTRLLLLLALTVLIVAALGAAADPPGAAAATVSSGPLQADTGSGRWRLSFEDRRARRVGRGPERGDDQDRDGGEKEVAGLRGDGKRCDAHAGAAMAPALPQRWRPTTRSDAGSRSS